MVKTYDCTDGGAQYCQGCYTMSLSKDYNGQPDESGMYVEFSDYAALLSLSAEKDTEIENLQIALSFWHPGVPAENTPLGERAAHDAFLLCGLDAPIEPCAVELGWISLSAEKDKTIADLDALVQSLQNRWAARPLSNVDSEHLERENIEKDKRIATLEGALIAVRERLSYRSDMALIEIIDAALATAVNGAE